MPYCYRSVAGVKLIPVEGQNSQRMWVYATSAAHPSALATDERAPDDHLYDGIELALEQPVSGQWIELRMTSDVARSLAAALVRAADIQQGLTR